MADYQCPICYVLATNLCSACKLVKYCCVEHQKQHWKVHKKQCRPYRVEQDPELGRCIVVTNNIKANQTIFLEEPLTVAPKWYLTEIEKQKAIVPCVGCYEPCQLGNQKCPKCGWPACSADCDRLTDDRFHSPECAILMLAPGPQNTNDMRNYYRMDSLIVLRCLLLQRQNPKKWTELLELQSHEAERLGTELHSDADKRIVSYLQQNFLHRLRQVEQRTKEKFLEYDLTLLHRLCGIIETNYMCIPTRSGLELSGLFRTACMIEHACTPNCYFQFDRDRNFSICVIAGCEIKKGEHLKISYSNILWGTQMRNEHLAITKHFRCKCDRCVDPTEYGTYLSAMICMGDVGVDCGGVQLPLDPLNLKADWQCDRCPMRVNGEEIHYLLSRMTDEVDTLMAQKTTILECENLIEKLSKFLHTNHYHLFSVKHTLIQLYGTEVSMSNLTRCQLEKKEAMCKTLFDLCLKLDPFTIKLSIYVAVILFELKRTLLERSIRIMGDNEKSREQRLAEAKALLMQGDELLDKGLTVLEKELDTITGRKLSQAFRKDKRGLELYLKQLK